MKNICHKLLFLFVFSFSSSLLGLHGCRLPCSKWYISLPRDIISCTNVDFVSLKELSTNITFCIIINYHLIFSGDKEVVAAMKEFGDYTDQARLVETSLSQYSLPPPRGYVLLCFHLCLFVCLFLRLFLGLFVYLLACLSGCLPVTKISQKVVDRFSRKFVERIHMS